jgi:hypothetical protein
MVHFLVYYFFISTFTSITQGIENINKTYSVAQNSHLIDQEIDFLKNEKRRHRKKPTYVGCDRRSMRSLYIAPSSQTSKKSNMFSTSGSSKSFKSYSHRVMKPLSKCTIIVEEKFSQSYFGPNELDLLNSVQIFQFMGMMESFSSEYGKYGGEPM